MNIQKLSLIDNVNYMNNIKLTIMLKVLLYDNKQKYIYVLKLLNNKFYVGRTSNIHKKIHQHNTSNGSAYTKIYKPIDIVEIIIETNEDDENKKTIEMMKLFE
jgi:predicted GIY-YIG superfamily endonuclease